LLFTLMCKEAAPSRLLGWCWWTTLVWELGALGLFWQWWHSSKWWCPRQWCS
jgi:hypothetical protein